MKKFNVLLTVCLAVGVTVFVVANSSIAADNLFKKDMTISGKGHGPGNGTGNGGNGPKDGTGNGSTSGTCTNLISDTPNVGNLLAVNLTETDKESLRFMREEEKLARDVYHVLFDMWGSRIFNNIAESEQTHMDAIKTLLDRYGIEDPASEIEGEFNNLELQTLYGELVAQGSVSLVEALNVGVIIEEKDIADLNDRMTPTLPKDIKTVYNNLLKGSLNHLKAFTSNLAMQGVILDQ